MKTTREKIEVMQAYENGKTIEISSRGSDNRNMRCCPSAPTWNWDDNDYSIKPEEKKKVKRWLWAMKSPTTGNWLLSNDFFTESEAGRIIDGIKQKIESSMIEVDE